MSSAPSGTSRSSKCIIAMKADAPSGTALALGDAAARGRESKLKAERGRDGTSLKREEGAIGFASLRGGTVAGDHDVMFARAGGAADPVAPRRKPHDLRPRRARRRALPASASRPASIRCATSSERAA